MDDPISREDAINAIYHHFPSMTMRECANVLHEVPSAEVTLCHLGSPCEYQNADIAMPSAQPERKVGKWIYNESDDMFECSVCGGEMTRNVFTYCPWCGERMVRGEEE